MAALLCHEDIKLCRICIGWLRGQSGAPVATATLPVRDIEASAAFYELAGFDVRIYDGGDEGEPPGFAFVEYDDESVFDLDRCPQITPDTMGGGCYLIIRDVDRLHAELSTKDLPVTPVEDVPWGMHEFTLTDPDGNHIRIGCSIDGSASS
jgi:hypothetical protein